MLVTWDKDRDARTPGNDARPAGFGAARTVEGAGDQAGEEGRPKHLGLEVNPPRTRTLENVL